MRIRKWQPLLGSMVLATSLLVTSSSTTFAAPKATRVTVALNGCPSTVQYGSSGTWVTALQFRLNSLIAQGYFSDVYLSTDGSFGHHTQLTVKDFQASQGLSNDGQVGPQTWTALGFCGVAHLLLPDGGLNTRSHCPPGVQDGSSGTWVSVLQSRLNYWYLITYVNKPGLPVPSYLGVNGNFGSQIRAAVTAFQKKWSMTANGKVGPQMWSRLGICY
jgi:peptidoglycan hydrolase-like protein with peptidoglycan-binding domain